MPRVALQQVEAEAKAKALLTSAIKIIERILKGEYYLASDLIELGLQERKSGGPRGLLCTPAPTRIPDESRMLGILKAAKVADTASRAELIMAFGEWGDDRGFDRLIDDFLGDPSTEVRSAVALALGKIGGPVCAKQLAQLAGNQYEEEELRLMALDLVEELAAGGWMEISSRKLPDGDPGNIVHELKAVFKGIETDQGSSDFLRMRAAATSEVFDGRSSDAPCSH